jgi:hypothetical protein
MIKKLPLITAMILLSMLPIINSGCGTNRIDLADNGTVSVEKVPSQNVKILWTSVYQDGEDLVVYGTVRRYGYSSYPMKTHVDIIIFSPDGTILQERQTKDICVPIRRPGRGISFARFRERFAVLAEGGSKVKIVCHSQSHDSAMNNQHSDT